MKLTMKVVLYARVSKDDAGQSGQLQNPDNQLFPLRDFAKAMNWDVVEEFVDRCSGGDSNRPMFQLMMAKARRHAFDMVIVWRLDRFSREGILNTLTYIKQLKDGNVALRSLHESWLDTSQEGVGELVLSIFAWAAQAEKDKISRNTKAGLARRRALGIRLGRHPLDCDCPKHRIKRPPTSH